MNPPLSINRQGLAALIQTGRQAAVIPYRAAFLRLHSLVVPFPTGNRGTGGFMPAGYGLSSLLTRSFCFPPSRLAA